MRLTQKIVSTVIGAFATVTPPSLAVELPQARIAKFAGDRAAAISYTFDDNLRDQYTIAVPMLNEFGFKGTFFVIPGKTAETVEAALKYEPKAWGGISWPELKEMADQGHEIASHSWSHPGLHKLPIDQVETELSKAYGAIKTRIGKPPLTLAFPYNASTPEVKALALKYYVAYRVYQTGVGAKSTVETLNTWADKLVTEQKWGVAMIHAIAIGFDALADPEILRSHLKYVKGREKDLWVDTFANIGRYEKERDEAKLHVEGSAGNVTCVITSSLDPALYNVPLTIVFATSGATSAKATRGDKALPIRIDATSIFVDAVLGTEPITVVWK